MARKSFHLFTSQEKSLSKSRARECGSLVLSAFLLSAIFSCTKIEKVLEPAASTVTISTWAEQPLLRNPVAISHDPQGRLYVTETQRRASDDLDIRRMKGLEPYPWQIEDWSMESTSQRRENIKRLLAEDSPYNNPWLQDLNGDSIKDWKDLETNSELIHVLEDVNGDGKADKSTLFAEGFKDIVTGVMGGVLWRPDGVFATVIPNLWKLKDENGDHIADQREAMFDGLGVHSGIGGHDMHGLRTGPDGKIYWTIGDKGINITTKEGKQFNYPNQGAMMRANPDGSDFEVVMHGLRNCQEIDFDNFGNWFCMDNDGDYKDEKERLVYILEGADAGWRVNWQMSYSQDWIDSKQIDNYNPWIDENLFLPHFDGQASYILPPLMNYSDGPCGFIRNPGTALSEEYRDNFFITQFPGQLLSTFKLVENGSAFKMTDEKTFVKGIMGTGLSFGPEGALYVADWQGGWSLNEKGGIRKIDIEGSDSSSIRNRTNVLLLQDYSTKSETDLIELLHFEDRRVRLNVQFELARRGNAPSLILVADNPLSPLLARVHALWAIRQIARASGDAPNLPISDWLEDNDPEFARQVIQLIGELSLSQHERLVVDFLENQNLRLRLEAGLSLAKIGTSTSLESVIAFLRENGDDAYLRHSGTRALQKIATAKQLGDLSSHPSKLVRLAAVVALREKRSPQLSRFLGDSQISVVEEAARAINDDFSVPESLIDLAELEITNTSEVVFRRVVNANLRLGREVDIRRLMNLALKRENPLHLRMEAMNAVSTWNDPAPLDRVVKRFRRELLSARIDASESIAPFLENLPLDLENEITDGLLKLADRYSATIDTKVLESFLGDKTKSHETRVAALRILQRSEPNSNAAGLLNDIQDLSLRMEIDLISNPDSEASVIGHIESVLSDPFKSTREKQEAINGLESLSSTGAKDLTLLLAEQLSLGKSHPALSLDIFQLIQKSDLPAAKTFLDDGQISDPYRYSLEGGRPERGKAIFENNASAQCARCHRVGEEGSNVGPVLTTIGGKRTKQHLLKSLLEPSAEISAGFDLVIIERKDGQVLSGSISSENDAGLILLTQNQEEIEIPLIDIKSRESLSSSVMPPMGSILNPVEIRDLVAYLDSLKN